MVRWSMVDWELDGGCGRGSGVFRLVVRWLNWLRLNADGSPGFDVDLCFDAAHSWSLVLWRRSRLTTWRSAASF